ncbi:MAG TPA: serine hydrolase [Trueperaceae bacterium]
MDFRRFESVVFDKMAASRLPGLSVSLVRDGELVYARGFGQRDLARGLAATPDTLYCIGSVTKSFTALAVLQLAERGLLRLDDPVSRHLPFDLEPYGEVVRLEHLLTHSTGLPALAYSEAVIRHANGTGGRYLPLSGPEDILTFVQDAGDWAETRPGERWFYFNEGYALLGLIVQRVSGRSYTDYVKEEILEPLGMSRRFFAREQLEAQSDVAVPYVLPEGGPPEPGHYVYRTIRSEGGLISSVLDLARYLKVFLEGGAGVVSRESLAAMMMPRLPMPYCTAPELFGSREPVRPDTYYGYALSVDDDFFGRRLVFHGGSVLVATAHLAFLPDHGVGVALLANGSSYPLSQLAETALACMLGEDPAELTVALVEDVLGALVGRYETYRGTMRAKVRRQGDFLLLEIEDRAQPERIILVPERLAWPEPAFFTLSAGRRLGVMFRREDDGVELLYERYKLRRMGPL